MLTHLFNRMQNKNSKNWNSRTQWNRKNVHWGGEWFRFFSYCWRGYSNKATKGERVGSLSQFKGMVNNDGEVKATGGHFTSLLRRQQWCLPLMLCLFSPLTQFRILCRKWHHPQWADLSPICWCNWDNSHRHSQSPISQVTLDSVKLTVNTCHHRKISKKLLWCDLVHKYEQNFLHTLKHCKDDTLNFSLFYL